ncbi:MAG: MBL fold metallo-hydrolase [Sedimentisphaerales bacterium]|nr:MBL fold metallo-hydrolase [Sedimentisphaerales bacterium]
MQIRLRFLGAAQNVTGSRHLLEVDGTGSTSSPQTRLLIDCGLYQERQYQARNWEPFVVPPESINAVLLTHAHLDHCGLLPKLVREGFKGKIYCTQATAEIARVILLDSAKLQEEDAEHKRKRHQREGRAGPYPEVPLYTIKDAEACFPHFEPVKYGQTLKISDSVEVTYCDAGHVLGSSMIKVDVGSTPRLRSGQASSPQVGSNGSRKTVLFTGDIGRPGRPILPDPSIPQGVDYLVIESTYGDRVHCETCDVKKQMADVINSTKSRGGNIVVPSFALERSQEILFYIDELLFENAIPHLMVFLDSPMAAQITEIFKRHQELFDEDVRQMVVQNRSPFELPGLKVTTTSDESKAINHISGTCVIIAGSGMCTGGRIKHHLANNISRKESTVMFVGYQAQGTLGRQLVDKAKEVRIFGKKYKIKAKVVQINGFSAHADKNEMLDWLRKFKTPPKQVFLVHGEPESAQAFGSFLTEKTGWKVSIPEYEQEVVLD